MRRARGWSQAHLAGRSGVSRAEISAVETGRLVPSVTAALRIAAALDTAVEQIFGAVKGPADPLEWAWTPAPDAPDGRAWRAAVKGRVLTYPAEPTAAGTIAHDGSVDGTRWRSRSVTAPTDTLVIAGCDPLVGLLAHEMAVRHRIRVLPLLRSSREALALLRAGLVHAAGVHYSDRGRQSNDRVVWSTLGAGHHLLHQLTWETGIAVVADRGERTPSALIRAKVRWVNREEGSAARKTFDDLLSSRRKPAGYRRVVHDHRAVAATVSSGWAEAGVCVRPAAAEARLSFIPIQREAYELCVSDAFMDDPRLLALVETLRSASYRRILADIPGCTVSDTGEVRAVA